MNVLRTEHDFAELADAYFVRAREQGVVHAEIFFDPQAHTARGVAFETVMTGCGRRCAKRAAVRHQLEANHVLSARPQRRVGDDDARAGAPYGERIVGVGLDSAEVGHPPSKFARVFGRALAEGWKTVAHPAEKGRRPTCGRRSTCLKVSRVDHGVRSLEDPALVARLRRERIPLTVCPLSNVKTARVRRPAPAHTGEDARRRARRDRQTPTTRRISAYVGDNFAAVAEALALTPNDVVTLARQQLRGLVRRRRDARGYLALLDGARPEQATQA